MTAAYDPLEDIRRIGAQRDAAEAEAARIRAERDAAVDEVGALRRRLRRVEGGVQEAQRMLEDPECGFCAWPLSACRTELDGCCPDCTHRDPDFPRPRLVD
jgi:hypothetical protein